MRVEFYLDNVNDLLNATKDAVLFLEKMRSAIVIGTKIPIQFQYLKDVHLSEIENRICAAKSLYNKLEEIVKENSNEI